MFPYTQEDLHNTIGQAANMGAAGVVMWGNRRDENTSPEICRKLNQYMSSKLGPYFESVKHKVEACSENKCNGHGRCIEKKGVAIQWLRSGVPSIGETCPGEHRTFTANEDTFGKDQVFTPYTL